MPTPDGDREPRAVGGVELEAGAVPVPRAVGAMVLALGIVGAACVPVGGFLLIVPAAVAILARR